jgi:hypothetical protein
MPFAGFDDFDDCLATMETEEGHDEESARRICGALQAESKSEHGNVEQLRDALSRGRGLIADVGVDLVSGVDVPAIDSAWVMTKSADAGHDYRVDSQIVLSKAEDDDAGEGEEDQRVAYAAAMIPRELDKEGDVVATPTVEKAAHEFLRQDGGVDTDHSLIEGDGEVVESWVLKDDRAFDLPGGETREYGAGTWMVGIKWDAEPWDRIQSGDLTGLSIYGMAEQVDLQKDAAACDCGRATATKTDATADATPVEKAFVVPFADESVVQILYASRDVAAKAAERMGFEGDVDEITHEHPFGDDPHYMPAPTHDEYVTAYNEFAEADGFGPVGDDGEMIVSASASAATVEKQPAPEYAVGDWVRWEFATGTSDGQVTDVRNEPGDTLSVDGNEREVAEDDPEPIYKVDVWREEDEELRGQAVKSESELRSIEPPAAFEASLDAAAKDDAAATDGETHNTDGDGPNKQDRMTDNDTVSALAEKVEGLTDDVSAIKDALDVGAETDEKAATDAIDDAVQLLADSEDVNAAAPDIRDSLLSLVGESEKAEHGDGEEMSDEMDEDEEDDEDDEEMSDSMDEKSKDAPPNVAKGYGGGAGTTANVDETDGEAGVPSYADLAANYGGN